MQDTLFSGPDVWEYTPPKKLRGPKEKGWKEVRGSGLQASIFDETDDTLAGFDRRCNICTLEFTQDTIAIDQIAWHGWYICDRCDVSIKEALQLINEGDDRGYGLIAKYTNEIRDNAKNNRLGYGVEIVAADELLTGE